MWYRTTLTRAPSIPPFLRHRCQSMLTAQWTHRLPFFQTVSPAERAASLILRTLSEIEDQDSSKLSVIDFCSGGGGPTPVIEKLVNAERERRGRSPIPFLLTDLHPNIDAWMRLASKSDNLSFLPQPVDATSPPVSVISERSLANYPNSEFHSDKRVFRLFCLAFHHFDDDMARRVLRSTLETSDAFAIIELQDRDLFSAILMFYDFFLVFLVTLFWFQHDFLQLIFTYLIPVIPFIMSFDGFISSLRTRKFEEVMKLVDEGKGGGGRPLEVSPIRRGPKLNWKTAEREGWTFSGGKEMHTFPLGYMNYFVGRKIK